MSKRKTVGLTVALVMLQASRALAAGTGFDWDPAFTTLEQALSGRFRYRNRRRWTRGHRYRFRHVA